MINLHCDKHGDYDGEMSLSICPACYAEVMARLRAKAASYCGPEFLPPPDAKYVHKHSQGGGFEQAKTWAEEIAALKVENAALREENTKLLEQLIALLGQHTKLLVEKEAREAGQVKVIAQVTNPSQLSPGTFPFNALKHSR